MAAAQQYRVARGRSLLAKGRVFQGGEVVPLDAVGGKKKMEEHVRSGFVVPAGGSETEAPPIGGTVTATEGGVTQRSEPRGNRVSPPVNQPKSPWTIDPKLIAGQSLEQLNVMAMERWPESEGEFVEFTDAEEARAYLSQHFQG